MRNWSSACFGVFKKVDDKYYDSGNSYDFPNLEENILSENQRRKFVVELEKKEETALGLIISGGIDRNLRPIIANLRPGSVAYRCDALNIGDFIMSINGIQTCKLKHEEIVSLLKNASNRVTLDIEYELPVSSSNNSLSVVSKIIQVKLEKENGSFGFTIRGGVSNDQQHSRPLFFTHVRFGGPANRVGTIKAGDRLLAIDGFNLSSATLQEALLILKNVSHSALFTIEYDVSIIDAVKNATGPLLVEIDKPLGCLMGLSLSCISIPEEAIVIESIRQASVAERCGALHVGDHVLSIDGLKVDSMTAVEAMQLLKSTTNGTVKFEILPVSQIALRTALEITKQGLPSPKFAPRACYSNFCYDTLSSFGDLSVNTCPPVNNGGCLFKKKPFNVITLGPSLINSRLCNSSHSSLTTLPKSVPSHVGTTERIEVILTADHNGFGFKLQGPSCTSLTLTLPPIISNIECDSPAERSAVLQVGDRILAVNGESTEGLTLDTVTNMIACSHSLLSLITEFDAVENVIPNSGTFTVKLLNGGSNLGITVAAPKNRQLGIDPLIISDVKKGSIAYRTRCIEPGDKLLAINSLRTEYCSVEDAVSVLQSCSDIIKLRIKKDEAFSEDPDATGSIIYTVELVRHGGPLGITVSGTEESFHPIYISSLTKNGLAERTGALHVGDRILAINGNSLRGKTLNEAICILQTCDKVTLKISKSICSKKSAEDINIQSCYGSSESHLKKFPTPLPSIDSAVDSWGSCNPSTSNCNNIASNEFYGQSGSDGNIFISCQNDETNRNVVIGQSNICSWSKNKKTVRSNSFAGLPSDEVEESWNKVLEDLETCGQSKYLREIEQSILGCDESSNKPISPPEGNFEIKDLSPSAMLSEDNLQELNIQIDRLNQHLKERDKNVYDQHSNFLTQARHQGHYLRLSYCSDPKEISSQPSQAYSASPVEIHKVTLFKDQIYEDFGFSLSDGKYENGVFINSIRPGGPADVSGLIKPLDKLLQVNNIKTCHAGLIVPLIASSGDRIELVISRPAYNSDSSSEDTFGPVSSYPWVEDYLDDEGSLSPYPSNSQTQTLTKTLNL